MKKDRTKALITRLEAAGVLDLCKLRSMIFDGSLRKVRNIGFGTYKSLARATGLKIKPSLKSYDDMDRKIFRRP